MVGFNGHDENIIGYQTPQGAVEDPAESPQILTFKR